MKQLKAIDPILFSLLNDEKKREESTINLIASENYTSKAVLEAIGSVLTNKYAEGYPGKRYYGGCQVVDEIELLAQQRCKELFNADHINVQPHSGSQANMAAYFSILNPGDTILGMNLAEGGHLTHGHSVNFSGKIFKSIQYSLNKDTEQLDYDQIELLAQEHKPKLIIVGASAYSRIIDFERFSKIARSSGSLLLADIAHIAGPIAAKLHPTPIPYADFVTSTTHKTLRGPRGGFIMCKKDYASHVDRAIIPGTQGGPLMNVIAAKAVAFKLAAGQDFFDYQKQILSNAKAIAQTAIELGYRVVSGGTDNHLFILDLRSQKVTGKEAQEVLDSIGINVSRSCIPFDTASPFITSGIRIGTPAITTRGMVEHDASTIMHIIHEALTYKNNPTILKSLAEKIEMMGKNFPIYGEDEILPTKFFMQHTSAPL